MCRDRFHEQKPFWNSAPVQTLLHFNPFQRFDVHLCRTAKIFFSDNDQFRILHELSIEQDQLWHSLSCSEWIYFAPYKCSTHGEKHPSLGDREGCSTSIYGQIFGFVNFCSMYFIHAVFSCAEPIKYLNRYFSLFVLYRHLFCRSIRMFDIRFVYPGCIELTSPGAS